MARNKKAKFEDPTKLADITMGVGGSDLPDLKLSSSTPDERTLSLQVETTQTQTKKRNRPKQIENSEGLHFLVSSDQLTYLDQMVMQARSNGGNRKLKRPAILRACIEFIKEAGVDLTGVQTEDEIKTRIKAASKRLR